MPSEPAQRLPKDLGEFTPSPGKVQLLIWEGRQEHELRAAHICAEAARSHPGQEQPRLLFALAAEWGNSVGHSSLDCAWTGAGRWKALHYNPLKECASIYQMAVHKGRKNVYPLKFQETVDAFCLEKQSNSTGKISAIAL